MPKKPRSRPIIFISHSARGDQRALDTLEVIARELKENGFDVLLDQKRLEPGDEWRSCLNTWMGHCHGAVLLLTKKALESDWVLKEATNLLWRRGLSEQKFPLIPVYLDVTSSEVAQCKRFQPLELTEVQGLKGLEGVAAAKELVNLFAPLRKQQVDTPQRLLEEKISNILRPIGKNLLERVVNSLGEELGGWAPDRDDHGRTAMLLLQAPLEKLLDALKPVVGVISKESLDSLIDILRGCWVKREIASMLTLVARQPPGTRAATLNATRQHFTANAVVVRAAVQHPAWTIIQLSPSTMKTRKALLGPKSTPHWRN